MRQYSKGHPENVPKELGKEQGVKDNILDFINKCKQENTINSPNILEKIKAFILDDAMKVPILQNGTCVILYGLQKGQEYNGKHGVICNFDKEKRPPRYIVQLEESDKKISAMNSNIAIK